MNLGMLTHIENGQVESENGDLQQKRIDERLREIRSRICNEAVVNQLQIARKLLW